MRYLILPTFAGLAASAFAQTLPDGPGKDTFEATCSVCHSPATVIGMHRTKDEWNARVTEMLRRQTDVSGSGKTTIVEYLARSFPATVNVNKATAKNIETIGGLSAKDASAIVQYRESKGNFETLDDLKKVLGVDGDKIEGNKQLLDFQ